MLADYRPQLTDLLRCWRIQLGELPINQQLRIMKFRIKALLIWHILLGFLLSYSDVIDGKWEYIMKIIGQSKFFFIFITTLIISFLYALSTYWMLFKFYKRKHISFIVFGIVLGSCSAITLRYLVQEKLQLILLGFSNYKVGTTFSYYVIDNIYYAIIYTAFGAVFFFVQYAQYKEVARQELLVVNQQSELALLRSQVNPHFLFNTLNNIYTLVYQKSDRALIALEQMTDLLRYGLYEQQEKVQMGKEVDALQSLINLEKMRFAYPVQVDFQVDEQVNLYKIAPFLLLPLVENAFKHGDFRGEASALSIQLTADSEWLIFSVKNAIGKQQKDQVGGIGLDNVRKRLQLIYEEHYQFDIEENDTNFEVTLKLALLVC